MLLIVLFIATASSAQNELPRWDGIHTVYIDTTRAIGDKIKLLARIEIRSSDVAPSYPNYAGFCGIELHGNSTLAAPKKSYELELRLENNEETSASILGFATGSDFVLLANYYDYSFLRNALAFRMWNRLGHYVPEYRYCQVFVNGVNQGLYTLVEQIKVQAGRLELGSNDEFIKSTHPSPAFLVKLDWEGSDLYTSMKSLTKDPIYYHLEYPKRKNLNYNFVAEITKFLNAVDYSLNEFTLEDPELVIIPPDNRGFESLIDVHSFADLFIVNELSKNPDGYKASTYFYRPAATSKDPNPKLRAGPIWDFDLAFANVQYEGHGEVEGWAYQQMGALSHAHRMPTWWHSLTCDEQFRSTCKERLIYLKNQFSPEACKNYLEGNAYLLKDAMQSDIQLWQEAHSREFRAIGPVDLSFAEDLTRIAEFYAARIEWMLNNLDSIPCLPPIVVYLEQRKDSTCYFQYSDERIEVPVYSEEEPRNNSRVADKVYYKLLDEHGELLETGILESSIQNFTFEKSKHGPGNYYVLFNEYYDYHQLYHLKRSAIPPDLSTFVWNQPYLSTVNFHPVTSAVGPTTEFGATRTVKLIVN